MSNFNVSYLLFKTQELSNFIRREIRFFTARLKFLDTFYEFKYRGIMEDLLRKFLFKTSVFNADLRDIKSQVLIAWHA